MSREIAQSATDRQELLRRLSQALSHDEMTPRAFRILGLRPQRQEAEAAGMSEDVIRDLEQGGLLVNGEPVALNVRALRVVMALLDGALQVSGAARLGVLIPQSLLAQIDDPGLRQELMDRDLVTRRLRRTSSTELPALGDFAERADTLVGAGPTRIVPSGSAVRDASEPMRESSGQLRPPEGMSESSGLLRRPTSRETSGLLRTPEGARESSGLLRHPGESGESPGQLREAFPGRDGSGPYRRLTEGMGSGDYPLIDMRAEGAVEPTTEERPTGQQEAAELPEQAPRTIDDTRRLLSELGQKLDDSGEG